MVTQIAVLDAIRKGLVWRIEGNGIPLETGVPHYFAVEILEEPVILLGRGLNTDSNELTLAVYENQSYTGGIEVPIVNKNRNISTSPPRSPVIVKDDVSTTPSGFPIFTVPYLSTNQTVVDDKVSDIASAWIFRANTTYIFSFLQESGSPKVCDFASILSVDNFRGF